MIMNLIARASILIFFSGIALLILAIMLDEAELGLLLIFPFIAAEGPIAVFAIVLLFLGIFAYFARFFIQSTDAAISGYEDRGGATPESPKKSKFGGVVLIGPLPIVFGSDKNVAKNMVILAIILVVALFLLFSLVMIL